LPRTGRLRKLPTAGYAASFLLSPEHDFRQYLVRALEYLELYVLSKQDFDAMIEASASFKEELRRVPFERQ